MEKVEWYNYRITLPDEYPLLEESERHQTREELLTEIFSSDIKTKLNGCSLEYHFIVKIESCIIALIQIAKQKIIHSKLSDSIDITPQITDDWHESVLILNVNSMHQTISISYNSEFGDILPKLRRIINKVKPKIIKQAYGCEIKPLLSEKAFWDVVQSAEVYKMQISASLPNMLGSDFTKDAKKYGKLFKSKKYSKRFENSDKGLSIESSNEEMNSAVEYMGKGELDIELYGRTESGMYKNKRIFDSKNSESPITFSTDKDDVEALKENTEESKYVFVKKILHFIKEFRKE